jgi:hypothetical protein
MDRDEEACYAQGQGILYVPRHVEILTVHQNTQTLDAANRWSTGLETQKPTDSHIQVLDGIRCWGDGDRLLHKLVSALQTLD